MRSFVRAYMYTWICVRAAFAWVLTFMSECACVRVCVCVRACVCVRVCVRAYVRVVLRVVYVICVSVGWMCVCVVFVSLWICYLYVRE